MRLESCFPPFLRREVVVVRVRVEGGFGPLRRRGGRMRFVNKGRWREREGERESESAVVRLVDSFARIAALELGVDIPRTLNFAC